MTIADLGRGHTTSDLVVVVPGMGRSQDVVFTRDLANESVDAEFVRRQRDWLSRRAALDSG